MTDTPAVTTPDLTSLDQPLGEDAATIVRALATRLADAGRVSDVDMLVEAVLAREALGSTVLPRGIAMPHARSAAVLHPSVAVARLPEPVAFSPDADPIRLVLLIAAAGEDPGNYLTLLQKVAAACVKNAFVRDLADAATPEAMSTVVIEALGGR